MNEHIREKFISRAKITNHIRSFLDSMGFLEVREIVALKFCK